MRRRVVSPIDKRIRKDHILGKIEEKRDVHFIYNEVKETYGANGTVSFPPPVILRMRLLFILYNVRSEREHMATIPERLWPHDTTSTVVNLFDIKESYSK